jgi:hypothetical protein
VRWRHDGFLTIAGLAPMASMAFAEMSIATPFWMHWTRGVHFLSSARSSCGCRRSDILCFLMGLLSFSCSFQAASRLRSQLPRCPRPHLHSHSHPLNQGGSSLRNSDEFQTLGWIFVRHMMIRDCHSGGGRTGGRREESGCWLRCVFV